jgi:AraC family transcriptional regulator
MIQEKTVNYYQQKVTEVLSYIDNHLGDDLNVKYLAERFGISHFHFHRIMQAAINQPLGNYINNRRLDLAAKLIRYSNEPLGEIAIHIGYNDLSSFSKAFTKTFGISPQIYRNDKMITLNTHIDYFAHGNTVVCKEIIPKMITLPPIQVYSIEVTGRYGGTETIEAWDELYDFTLKNRLLEWKPDVFSVYYSDPDVVPDELCESEICVASKKSIPTTGRIQMRKMEGGKFAVFRYKGSYDLLWELYDAIYRSWLPQSGLKLCDSPFREKYLNYQPTTKPEKLLTEVYIPVE